MIFSLLGKIEGVKHFSATSSNILTSVGKTLTTYEIKDDSITLECSKEFDAKIYDIKNYSSNEAIISFEQYGIRLNIQDLSVIEDLEFGKLSMTHGSLPINNQLLVQVGEDILNQSSAIYDLLERRLIANNKLNLASNLIDGKLLGCLFNKQVVRFNEIDGNPIWTFDISLQFASFIEDTDKTNTIKETKITNLLGICNSVVWVSLSSGVLIALDIETGELKHTIKEAFGASNMPLQSEDKSNQNYIIHGNYVQLDILSRKIIGLKSKWYSEVDLNKPEFNRQVWDISKAMIEKNVRGADIPSYSWPIDDRYIYFCDGPIAVIAIFERESRTVLETQKLFDPVSSFSQILKMEMCGKMLLVYDIKERLHIFKIY